MYRNVTVIPCSNRAISDIIEKTGLIAEVHLYGVGKPVYNVLVDSTTIDGE